MNNKQVYIPDITWYHDDVILKPDKKIRITIQDEKTRILIKTCEIEDSGVYICKAISRIGEALTKAKLNIKSTTSLTIIR